MSCWSTRAASARRRCARCSASGDWPARNPDRNIADLKAQVAACARGASELRRVAGEYGRARDRRLYGPCHGQCRGGGAAADRPARATARSRYEMDNGAAGRGRGHGRPRQRARRSSISPAPARQLADNFNAPHSICRAATLYVFRTLVDDAIPLNDGCLRPITLDRARRLDAQPALSRPRWSPAMSRPARSITDACSPRCGALAPSQGTMNNFTFGNERYQYYETIAGGAGAGPGFRRGERGPDPYDQQPADRSRDTGDALSGAARALRDPPRLGRRGRASRRRRRRAPHPLPRADAAPASSPTAAAWRRAGSRAAAMPCRASTGSIARGWQRGDC